MNRANNGEPRRVMNRAARRWFAAAALAWLFLPPHACPAGPSTNGGPAAVEASTAPTNLLPRRHIRRRYDAQINMAGGGERPEMPKAERAPSSDGATVSDKRPVSPSPLYTYPSAYVGTMPAAPAQEQDTLKNWITASVEDILQVSLMTGRTNASGWGWLAAEVMRGSGNTNAPASRADGESDDEAAEDEADVAPARLQGQEDPAADLAVDEQVLREAVINVIRATNQPAPFVFRGENVDWRPDASAEASWRSVSPPGSEARQTAATPKESVPSVPADHAAGTERRAVNERTEAATRMPGVDAMAPDAVAPSARLPVIGASRPGGDYWGLPAVADGSGVPHGVSPPPTATRTPLLPDTAPSAGFGSLPYGERGAIFGPSFRSTSQDFGSLAHPAAPPIPTPPPIASPPPARPSHPFDPVRSVSGDVGSGTR
jgi:hypothetical protein